ncbi:hypothetical protein D3C81_1172730 [compost metagenome]
MTISMSVGPSRSTSHCTVSGSASLFSICGTSSLCFSTSVTWITSMAWCAVRERPLSEKMFGCGRLCASQNSLSIPTTTPA